MKTLKLATELTILATILSACGGGSSSGGSSSASSSAATSSTTSASSSVNSSAAGLLTGVFADSAVAGLTYTTSSGVTGSTSSSGEYNYYNGDTVTFKMYGTTLNTAAAALILTPADAKDVDLDYTINLLRFLQTIDTDQNLSNGITLPTVDSSDASIVINFNQDMYAFEQDTTMLGFLSKYASGRSLVDLETAISHFNSTIAATSSDTILNLTGADITTKVTSNLCNNPDAAYQTLYYTVGGTTYKATGSTVVSYGTSITTSTALKSITCSISARSTNSTVTIANITDAGNVFYGGPSYTYQKMNRISIKSAQTMTTSPAYGLKSVEIIWHTPGTSTITSVRHFIKTSGVTPNCPYYSVKEVHTINNYNSLSSSSSISSTSSASSSSATSSTSSSAS